MAASGFLFLSLSPPRRFQGKVEGASLCARLSCPRNKNQWGDLEHSKLCSRAVWPGFPSDTHQCELALLGNLSAAALINTSVHYASLMNIGNDWGARESGD